MESNESKSLYSFAWSFFNSFYQTAYPPLKVRWPRFQARALPLSFPTTDVRAAASPSIHSDLDQYAHILRNLSHVGRKTSSGVTVKASLLPSFYW